MKEIITQIKINASPEEVWKVLTDFQSYSLWNPFVKRVSGSVRVGNRIKITLPKMSFKPKVVSFELNTCFSWIGHLFIKGLFDGEHRFVLIQNEDGTTTLEHAERFSGVLVPLLSKELLNTEKGFVEMNEALKKRVEGFEFLT